MILGDGGESVILVGSQGRFTADDYPIRDGEALLAEVQSILAPEEQGDAIRFPARNRKQHPVRKDRVL